jgi:hypothetical protein
MFPDRLQVAIKTLLKDYDDGYLNKGEFMTMLRDIVNA